MKLKFFITILVFTIISISCGNIKFEKLKWLVKDDMEYPFRKKMVEDLLQNNNFKGKKYQDIIEILGEPNSIGSSSFEYQIYIDFGFDIDPIASQSLIFKMNKDSIITTVENFKWERKNQS